VYLKSFTSLKESNIIAMLTEVRGVGVNTGFDRRRSQLTTVRCGVLLPWTLTTAADVSHGHYTLFQYPSSV
jgi:hypothetical protein